MIVLFLLVVLQTVFPQEPAEEHFSKQSFYSEILARKWDYSVYLPSGYYSHPDEKYPVIYLLHGMTNNHHSFRDNGLDRVFTKLIEEGKLPPTIFVSAQGFGHSWWINSAVYGNIEDAFIKELIPMVENIYRIQKSRGKRVISGISMGGYGALRLALLYPELFYSAVLLSPAVFYPLPGNEVIYSRSNPFGWYYSFVVTEIRNKGVFGKPFDPMYYLALSYRRLFPSYLKKKTPVKFYAAYGSKDNVTDNASKNMIAYFRINKHPIEVLAISGGGHNWATWKKAYEQILNGAVFAQENPKK